MLHLLTAAGFLLSCASDRYLCGPGTHVDGDWCVGNDDKATGSADTGKADTGTAVETGDSASDSGEDSAEIEPARLVLNEYMASNDAAAADEHGGYDDWIEVYNAGGESADLSNCSLSDDSERLGLYTFPAGSTLAAGAWVVVWADETPSEGDYHAAFSLSSSSDRIFLIRDPQGAAEVLDSVEFTGMRTDIASARIPDGASKWLDSELPTPGAANDR